MPMTSSPACAGVAVALVSAGGLLAIRAAGADERLTQLPLGDPARRDREVALVLDAITDTASGQLLSPAGLAARLDGVRVLLAGEEHTDLDAHRVQARIIEELHERGRRVLIGLEMFPASQQAVLDQWRDGLLTEAGFLRLAGWYEHWGYPWELYRPIFLFARDHALTLQAVNIPREIVSAVRQKGFDALDAGQRALLPPKIATGGEEHRALFLASFEHDDTVHAQIPAEQLEGMLRAQATWDAALGWNAANAVESSGDPAAIIVVLVGTGHVSYGLGAERQLRAGGYRGRIASLIPVPLENARGEHDDKVRASYADFVWGIPAQRFPEHPLLGISLAGSPGAQPTRIIQVAEGSPAARAGLAVGDVLLEIDGHRVGSPAALRERTAAYRWGDVAHVKLERKGEVQDYEVAFRR